MTDVASPPKHVARRLTHDERAERGRAARQRVPRSAHAEWVIPDHRPDPVMLLQGQAETRVRDLIPIRHARMLVSPFTYFRGAALPMASDLASTPHSGLRVQLCGDAHLSNFGIFGSPERHLVFDLNDFDETLPGPFEWDVKRLAASLEVAARDNGYTLKQRRAVVTDAAGAYRHAMVDLAARSSLDVWYAHLDVDNLMPRFNAMLDPKKTPAVWKAMERARTHDSLQAFGKLTEIVDGEPRIIDRPPLIVPIRRFVGDAGLDELTDVVHRMVRDYRRTLQPDRRLLLEQYELIDIARKVVGVGSVGTQAWIALLLDRSIDEPLFLQIKEAQPSVLETYLSKSEFANHGQRVVAGQRLMQAVSDIFLGWEHFAWRDRSHDYYVRQLRDWKGSAEIGGMTPAGMQLYAQMCGWTLARAHARSGDRIAIAAYLGNSDVFDRAIVRFSEAYADQNERDYAAMQQAVVEGRLEAAQIE